MVWHSLSGGIAPRRNTEYRSHNRIQDDKANGYRAPGDLTALGMASEMAEAGGPHSRCSPRRPQTDRCIGHTGLPLGWQLTEAGRRMACALAALRQWLGLRPGNA